LLQQEVAQLLAKADQADSAPLQDGLTIPAEIARRRDRIQKLQAARATLEQRAAQKAAAAQTTDAAPTVPPPPDPPASHGTPAATAKPRSKALLAPKPKDQYNFTDPDSRIMKAGNGAHFEQAYNAQAAVTTDSHLVVAARVTQAANDKQQLEPTLAAVPTNLRKKVTAVLADNGFYSADAVAKIEAAAGPTVYAAVEKRRHHRTVADLEKRPDPPPPAAAADPQERMRHRLRTTAGRALYRLRQQTVEPVFGIIKEAMGFRRFHLRGQAGVALEWTLVCVAYNLRRLHRLQLAAH
jgi:hypothetical protein